MQLTRDSASSRGFLSARSVTGFLSDVYPAAADEVGKIHIVADERVLVKRLFFDFLYFSCMCKIIQHHEWYHSQVQAAVFDLPEEIAKELLSKQVPPGNTIAKITKVV